MNKANANIFIGQLENKLSVNLKPFSWLTFMDDIDIYWTHDRENLEVILKKTNGFHP